jgi:vacuolar-type H+-ATPase subunit I/STV1
MKNVLDKINKADEIQANKVELGMHEVELGLLDDLKALNAQGEKLRQGVNQIYSLRSQMVKYAKEERNKVVKYLSDVEKLTKNAETKAKELGLNLNDNTAYKNAKNRLAELNKINEVYTKFLSSGII